MTNHAMLDTYIEDARWNVKYSRKVIERIVVTADLVVQTPLHLARATTTRWVALRVNG